MAHQEVKDEIVEKIHKRILCGGLYCTAFSPYVKDIRKAYGD